MNHGFEVIDGADCRKFGALSTEKGFIDLPLDGGAAVGGAEGHTQTAGGYKFGRQAGLFEDLFGYLAGVICNGAHGLAERAPKVEIKRIINGSKYLGVDDFRQQVILAERLDTGHPSPEA